MAKFTVTRANGRFVVRYSLGQWTVSEDVILAVLPRLPELGETIAYEIKEAE